MIGWLTVDEPGTETCRALRIPQNFVAHVMGALAELTESYNWEQDGILTPGECADIMAAMWEDVSECTMVGEICFFDTAVLPDNFLLCDGTEYLRVDYPVLYSVIANPYIVDGDHFIAPQRMDRFVRGGESAGIEGGSNTITVDVANMPPHSHVYQEKTEILFPFGAFTPDISARGTLLESGRDTSIVGSGEAIVTIPIYTTALIGIRWR